MSSGIADHPRACGANHAGVHDAQLRGGSSPRMRGKQYHLEQRARETRIIPAHAGQTIWKPRPPRIRWDHPRACGANPVPYRLHVVVGGSSPRMRGKRSGGKSSRSIRRIIPAHAGQTLRILPRGFTATDHPRACGANDLKVDYENAIAERKRRIIPAHAGQTPPYSAQAGARPDHPRACGANNAIEYSSLPLFGSSPRMRGKR